MGDTFTWFTLHFVTNSDIMHPISCCKRQVVVQVGKAGLSRNGQVYMRNLLRVIAVLVFLAGGVFFLQGINVLPGSFMTGQPEWVRNGAIIAVVGIILFALAGLIKPRHRM